MSTKIKRQSQRLGFCVCGKCPHWDLNVKRDASKSRHFAKSQINYRRQRSNWMNLLNLARYALLFFFIFWQESTTLRLEPSFDTWRLTSTPSLKFQSEPFPRPIQGWHQDDGFLLKIHTGISPVCRLSEERSGNGVAHF